MNSLKPVARNSFPEEYGLQAAEEIPCWVGPGFSPDLPNREVLTQTLKMNPALAAEE
jgi:hypothetical protein